MEEIERSGASVEEAVEAALTELGISEQEAHVEVVQEPKSGFLGFSSQPAIVRVARATPPTSTQDQEALDQQADVAADFLEDLLDAMGIQAEVEISDVDGMTYVDIWGSEESDDIGLLIGKHGNTVEALQEMARIVVQRVTGERCQVVVDVEDYRKRRRSQILRRARDAARRVKKTGQPEALEPMGAFDRKLVHDTVAEFSGLETSSEGDDPNRRVVIRRK